MQSSIQAPKKAGGVIYAYSAVRNFFKIFLLLLAVRAFGETPDAPEPKFLSKCNLALVAFSGAAVAGDEFTTQRWMSNPNYHETNPVTRPLGKSRPVAVGIGAASVVGTVGAMYLAHRKHWKHMEWIVPVAVGTIETAYSIYNSRLSPLGKKRNGVNP